MTDDPFRHPGLCAMAGVSRLPEPLDWRVVREAIARERAVTAVDTALAGSVLLSLEIDAGGAVTSAAAVDRPAHPGIEIRAVLLEHDGRQRPLAHSPEAPLALRQIAAAAVRRLRFRPAERDGSPVAFRDYRLTMEIAAEGAAG